MEDCEHDLHHDEQQHANRGERGRMLPAQKHKQILKNSIKKTKTFWIWNVCNQKK